MFSTPNSPTKSMTTCAPPPVISLISSIRFGPPSSTASAPNSLANTCAPGSLSTTQMFEALQRDMSKTTHPEDHAGRTGMQQLCGPFGRAIRGDPGIRHRRHLQWHDPGIQLDQGAFGGLEILGETTIQTQARKLPVFAIHVMTIAAAKAYAAAAQRMADHCIPRFDRGHGAADILDPTGILMPHGVRQKRAVSSMMSFQTPSMMCRSVRQSPA